MLYKCNNVRSTDWQILVANSGVGLPSSKHKIAVGETYSFTCGFNVPALTPSMNVPGLLETCYMVNIAVGRAHNFVIASLRVPITIVTDIVNMERAVPAQREDLLIELTPPTWKKTDAGNRSPRVKSDRLSLYTLNVCMYTEMHKSQRFC
ncbi:hypothetical protein COOONC_09728 [Cooperia oncophora]